VVSEDSKLTVKHLTDYDLKIIQDWFIEQQVHYTTDDLLSDQTFSA
jgi:hypothetical protein